MIYTVTLNPAVDYTVRATDFRIGEINRPKEAHLRIGGKGINVSLVLAALGVPSVAMGFVAGFTGDAIEAGVREAGVEADFVRLDNGFSRINLKLCTDVETELNGPGPDVPTDKLAELLNKLDRLQDGDTLVLSGSIPPTLPSDIYARMLARPAGKAIRVAVDTTGEALRAVLPYRPFIIKPNRRELEELLGESLDTQQDLVRAARRLQAEGARHVLVSLGGDGALLLDGDGHVHTAGACRGTVQSTVGAGDSMLAGFLAGCGEDAAPNYAQALRLGTACGGATAFSVGPATGDAIRKMYAELA